jgi:DNA-binding NtrC family response regulator
MERSTVLIVSKPAQAEHVLPLLRNKQWVPVLISDIVQASAALAGDLSVGLIVLTGNFEFCSPFLTLVAESRSKRIPPPLVIVATESSEAFAIAALRAGAADYFAAPFNLGELAQSIAPWPPSNSLRADDRLNGGETLVGNSPAMRALRVQIRRVGATDCTVLITGETGTGKELVAQLVHQNSVRRGHPLICVNCAAIPDALLESELFGYERGAFTGANAMSQGKLMAANKGTVFFDEIGDMSPYAQAKILRAIESKEVQRLGATRKHETDVRILAATHHDLDGLANADTFRRDLYFRLNVGRIHLPPLRERKADITGLIDRMVLDLNRKLSRRIEGATERAISALRQYDWPGNVRELKNVIERIFISRDSGKITEEDLPSEMQRFSAKSLSVPYKEEKELQCLRSALATCNGNKSKAAERLNWSRMTLYRKLAKYKLIDGSSKPTGLSDGSTKDSASPKDSPPASTGIVSTGSRS